MTTTPRRTTTQATLDAIQQLHEQEQVVTRETLAELTGLKLAIIDDHTRTLIEQGHIRRVQRGVYVPAATHPPARPISKTLLPDGTVKIDIGDQVLTLTPREDRMLSALMAGAAAQLSAIEAGHNATILASDLNTRLNRMERLLTAAQV